MNKREKFEKSYGEFHAPSAQPMSEGKQEARELKPLNITDDRPDYEWNGEFTQESLNKGVKASAERRRQANQPQEKAQPEPFTVNATTRISPMRECGLEIRCTEPHGHTGAHSWGKAQPESGEMGQEAGISLEEINAAITGHDFSAADPQVNFWVNRAIWLRDQHCREIEQNDVALIAHLADWICEVDGYSRQGLIDRINVCFNELLVTHPAFQRGQQAMAEKAAQLADELSKELKSVEHSTYRKAFSDDEGSSYYDKHYDYCHGCKMAAIVKRLRSLASAEPPEKTNVIL